MDTSINKKRQRKEFEKILVSPNSCSNDPKSELDPWAWGLFYIGPNIDLA